MATGMAIMGFGGGAMIGSPLATILMNYYATPTSVERGNRANELLCGIGSESIGVAAFRLSVPLTGR